MASTGIKKDGTFYVCETAQPDDLLQAEFEALTWVEVGNIVTLPDFGYTQNTVTQDYINTDMSQKRKGFKQGSESDLVIGRDYEDAGQTALRTIVESPANYAFKLELSDSPNPATTTNTVMYSRGIASGWNFSGGGGEDFDNATITIGLNQQPVIVDPEAI